MVEFLTLYALFCLTTALAGVVTLLNPVLDDLANEQPQNAVVESRLLAVFVFILLGAVTAPLLIFPAILPGAGNVFKESIFNAMKD